MFPLKVILTTIITTEMKGDFYISLGIVLGYTETTFFMLKTSLK